MHNFALRLRFLWAVLCIVAAAVALVSFSGGGGERALVVLVAASIAAFSLYAQTGWYGRASLAWLSTTTALAFLMKPEGTAPVIGMGVIAWGTVSVITWLARGRFS